MITPAAKWRIEGLPDPHGTRYETERAELMLGEYTDDELANGAYLNYDRRVSMDDLTNPKEGQYTPLIWMTAVKDRIRWLSRSLEKALSRLDAVPARQFEGTRASAEAIVAWACSLGKLEHNQDAAYILEHPADNTFSLWVRMPGLESRVFPCDWVVRAHRGYCVAIHPK